MDDVRVKELVEVIARSLVDDPHQVLVKQIDGYQTSLLELYIVRNDLGKIIGKGGKSIGAL